MPCWAHPGPGALGTFAALGTEATAASREHTPGGAHPHGGVSIAPPAPSGSGDLLSRETRVEERGRPRAQGQTDRGLWGRAAQAGTREAAQGPVREGSPLAPTGQGPEGPLTPGLLPEGLPSRAVTSVGAAGAGAMGTGAMGAAACSDAFAADPNPQTSCAERP